MRRIFVSILVCMIGVTCYAQGIYRTVEKYDKFDDVVWKREVKTLITKTDSTFIIETKGQKPEEYFYLDNFLLASHYGSKDSLVNLVQDVWGYEDQYIVFTQKDRKECVNVAYEQVKDLPDSLVFDDKIRMLAALELMKRVDKLPTISIRTISRYKFDYEYKTDLFWIKFSDRTRIIYER